MAFTGRGEGADAAAAAPPPIDLSDRRISALAAAAGSDEAVARGKWLAAGMVLVGMVGAVGVGLRPIYRQHFAARAAAVQRSADAARRVMARDAGEALPAPEAARLAALLERLDELQARHRARHPLWYGELPPEMLVPPALPGGAAAGEGLSPVELALAAAAAAPPAQGGAAAAAAAQQQQPLR